MAWIAWSVGLQDKPKVNDIAQLLGVNRWEAAAKCMAVWAWADHHTDAGRVRNMTPEALSERVGAPGIAEAMVSVGWITSAGGLTFKDFHIWNGKTAHSRMKKSQRQSNWRARVDERVDARPSTRASTREEKRRVVNDS